MHIVSSRLIKTNIASSLILNGFQRISYVAKCPAKRGEINLLILKLYIFESCNSCPPADKWLSAQMQDQT